MKQVRKTGPMTDGPEEHGSAPAEEPTLPPSNWPGDMDRLRSSCSRPSHRPRIHPDRDSTR
jgi:hypothetical protein